MAGKLSSAQLSALQATVTSALDQTATIQRKSPVQSGYGTVSDNYQTKYSGVACNLARPSAQQMQQYAERIGDLAIWQVRFPANEDVLVDDQLLVMGLTLRVQALLNPQSYSLSTTVLASEVR